MAERAHVTLVVAIAENGVIGKGGGLPWKLSSDLKHFRMLTMGKPVIMGRKTFETIGKPLDGRDNIVVTRNPDFEAEGILLALSFEQAIRIARELALGRGADDIAVIGGAQIYAEALPIADAIELTEVHDAPDGDTYFPSYDEGEWREVSRARHAAGPKDSADYSFVRLERAR
jgi:dihydrofolate reductase